MSNIKIVRLTSGEEILCDLVVNGDTYILKEPAVIIPTAGGNIGFARWLPYADISEVSISKKFVMFAIDPVAKMVDKYNEMNSPLLVPPVKEIVGAGGEPIVLKG